MKLSASITNTGQIELNINKDLKVDNKNGGQRHTQEAARGHTDR